MSVSRYQWQALGTERIGRQLPRHLTASFIKKQEGLGAVVATDKRIEPAEHKKFVQAEVARFGPVIKAAGIYAD
ncbi:hypothetical protein BLA14095_06702 [Burkholderia lata]|nr:hypothetical protein BLA14095_06702 [Burkholderia lata]